MAGNGEGWAKEKGVVLVDRDKGQGSVWRTVMRVSRLWGSECVTPRDRYGCEDCRLNAGSGDRSGDRFCKLSSGWARHGGRSTLTAAFYSGGNEPAGPKAPLTPLYCGRRHMGGATWRASTHCSSGPLKMRSCPNEKKKANTIKNLAWIIFSLYQQPECIGFFFLRRYREVPGTRAVWNPEWGLCAARTPAWKPGCGHS